MTRKNCLLRGNLTMTNLRLRKKLRSQQQMLLKKMKKMMVKQNLMLQNQLKEVGSGRLTNPVANEVDMEVDKEEVDLPMMEGAVPNATTTVVGAEVVTDPIATTAVVASPVETEDMEEVVDVEVAAVDVEGVMEDVDLDNIELLF